MDPLTEKMEVRRPQPKFGWSAEAEALETEVQVESPNPDTPKTTPIKGLPYLDGAFDELDKAIVEAMKDALESPDLAPVDIEWKWKSNVQPATINVGISASSYAVTPENEALVASIISGTHTPLRAETFTNSSSAALTVGSNPTKGELNECHLQMN